MFIIHGFQIIAKDIGQAISEFLKKYPGRRGDVLEVREGKKIHYVKTDIRGNYKELRKRRK